MNDGSTNSISVTKVHLALQQLLATYQSEKAESQRDDDTRFIEYWDSACQTIYDVAAALTIPFEEQCGAIGIGPAIDEECRCGLIPQKPDRCWLGCTLCVNSREPDKKFVA